MENLGERMVAAELWVTNGEAIALNRGEGLWTVHVPRGRWDWNNAGDMRVARARPGDRGYARAVQRANEMLGKVVAAGKLNELNEPRDEPRLAQGDLKRHLNAIRASYGGIRAEPENERLNEAWA